MAGVLIPVIVHLWNDRRGKVLRIGSVVLMRGASRQAAWSVRLTELLLLAVRCLLVVFSAALLAGPFFVRRAAERGWVLVAGHDLRADSLERVGYERHVLDSGGNYWDEFRRMDKLAAAGVKFYVFTPGLVSGFSGLRPSTAREVHWMVYTPGDSVAQWLEKAYRVSADSVIRVRGVSRATGTVFLRERVASPDMADTAAVGVVLEGNRQEVSYMQAALKALGDYTGHTIRVSSSGGRVIRWRPEWEEAAWGGRLPVLLGRLLFGRDPVGPHDRRVIDPGQALPLRVGAMSTAAGSGERVDLRPVLWGILFLLFIIERMLVFRHDKA